jgi:hypothetical protein
MLEFCYLANLVAFYYLFFDPLNAVLRRVRPLAGTTSLRPAARRGCRALRSGPGAQARPASASCRRLAAHRLALVAHPARS